MNTETIKPVLAPAMSADSKRNAFYTTCPELQQRRPYPMCQHIIDNRGDANVQELYGDCMTAIRRGKCVAVGMREEEALKGVAIYFIERAKVTGDGVDQATRSQWNTPAKVPYVRDKYAKGAPPAAHTVKAPEFDGNIYAAALSKAQSLSRSSATNSQILDTPKTTGALAPAVTHVSKAGESPLDLARRLRAAQPQS
jgi:hypothetical protein